MFKKIWQRVKNLFKLPELGKHEVELVQGVPHVGSDFEQMYHRKYIENIAIESLGLNQEALQKSLAIQHRTMIVAIIAVIISFISSTSAIVIAIKTKPHVVVQLIQPNEQKTIQKTN